MGTARRKTPIIVIASGAKQSRFFLIMGIRFALCAMRFALFRRGLTLRLRLRSVLGDCAGDALWVNPEQVEGLTSPYQFNTLLVVLGFFNVQAVPALMN